MSVERVWFRIDRTVASAVDCEVGGMHWGGDQRAVRQRPTRGAKGHLGLGDFCAPGVVAVRPPPLCEGLGERAGGVPALDEGADLLVGLLGVCEDLGGVARVRGVQRGGVDAVLVVLVDVDPAKVDRSHAGRFIWVVCADWWPGAAVERARRA